MPDRSNPTAYQIFGTIQLGASAADERTTIERLCQQGLTADSARSSWLDRQSALTRLRMGIRTKKSFPWPNCSNLSIPFIDDAIRKWKPSMMRLVVEPNPVVEFVGEDFDAVKAERLAEVRYNWLFKIEMDAITPISYLLDRIAHRGSGFLQLDWQYESEWEVRTIPAKDLIPPGYGAQGGAQMSREELVQFIAKEYRLYPDIPQVRESIDRAVTAILGGAEFVKLAFKRVVHDRPRLVERDPVAVIGPPRCTDWENAEFIIVQHIVSLRWVQQREADGFFIKGTAAAISADIKASKQVVNPPGGRGTELDINTSQSLSTERREADQREKIWGVDDEENVMLWEYFHWYDYNSDGYKERVHTFLHPRTYWKCRSVPYAMPFHEWPLVKFDFERVERRWYSPRGISQLLADLQIEVNDQHNGRIDAMTLRNAPAYQINVLSTFKGRNYRAAPGTVIELPSGAQMTPLTQDRGAFPEQIGEENLLRSIGEHYIGIFDAAITSPQSQTRARTATEISAIVQYTAATATMDAIIFQDSMRKVHEKVWMLYMDMGPEESFVKVTGNLPMEQGELELRRVSKGEINKKFRMIPTGTIANTNRALELQNAREAMSMFVNDQTGFINARALRDWYISLLAQPRWARRILLSPEMAQEQQILRQGAQILAQEPQVLAAARGGGGQAPPLEQPRQELANAAQAGPASIQGPQ